MFGWICDGLFEGKNALQRQYQKKNESSVRCNYMGVYLNGGTPKWMVKIMENPIKMGDLGVPSFYEPPI